MALSINDFTALTDPSVSRELPRLLLLGDGPDTVRIGTAWQRLFPANANFGVGGFEKEAALFVGLLRVRLGHDRVLGGVISAIWKAQEVAILGRLENEVRAMRAELFGLNKKFDAAPERIRSARYSFASLIEDLTKDFVGRDLAFTAIQEFVGSRDREDVGAYFFVTGEPGAGKSALLARLVATRAYVHHFNVQRIMLSKAREFLQNVCAQLIVKYELRYTDLPLGTDTTGQRLMELLHEAATRLKPSERIVILVDALDEAVVEDCRDSRSLRLASRSSPLRW